MQFEKWFSCYNTPRDDLFTRASNRHPAKMAVGLCFRIFKHGEEKGYWKKGDLILDPLAGIFTTGLYGAVLGYRVLGIELEKHFVELARKNVAFAHSKFHPQGDCEIIQGDARHLSEFIRPTGVLTSPPYADQMSHDSPGGIDWTKQKDGRMKPRLHSQGNLPNSYSAAVTSPPYGETHVGNPGEQELAAHGQGRLIGTSATGHGGKGRHGFQYSHDETAQIGNLRDPKNDIDVVISSPPYLGNPSEGTEHHPERQEGAEIARRYGDSAGQIGNFRNETYLQAMFKVYFELHRVLKPGGVCVLVTKNPVKNKQIRRLDLDTIRLMEACGFQLIEHIHAMLTEETEHGHLFGGPTVRRHERKSFFKRLFESKNPSLRVDHEDVLIFRGVP